MAGTMNQNTDVMSPASQALGIGDVAETDEERKKRLQAIAQSQQRLGAASDFLSPAGSTLGLS